MKNRVFVSILIWAGILASVCAATTYHVRTNGDDVGDGLTRKSAFRTIQRGVDALEAGDTLIIGPGEYREQVVRKELGSEDCDTLIKAEIPGMTVLRGDIPAPEFKPVPGFRYIYGAPFDGSPQAVNEVDTLTICEIMPNLAELEFTPAASAYDPETKMLYVSTSDMQPISNHVYSVSVFSENGILLEDATRVIVDGLAFGGYNTLKPYPRFFTNWGILLVRCKLCVVRNSTAFLSGGGIGFFSMGRGSNLVERCLAYANHSRHYADAANIFGSAPCYDTIRNCTAFRGKAHGIMYHAQGKGPGVMADNFGWGNVRADVMIKGTGFEQTGESRADRCIALGKCHVLNLHNSLVGGSNAYRREGHNPMGPDTVRYSGATFADRDRIFADPVNFDFRLQPDASIRGSGPEGGDPGPFPYKNNIFYVIPDGDDEADGLATSSAWRSLERAMSGLQPGDTLYIGSGEYEVELNLKLNGTESEPVSIRGRGREPVIIRGKVNIRGGAWTEWQRIHFYGSMAAEFNPAVPGDMKVEQCVFDSYDVGLSLKGDGRLLLSHSVFTGFHGAGTELTQGARIIAEGTIFDNRFGPAIRGELLNTLICSRANSFADEATSLAMPTFDYSMAELKEQNLEFDSQVIQPQFEIRDGVINLVNESEFAGRGPLATSIGLYRPDDISRFCLVTDLRLFKAGDTTANLEWWLSKPATVTIAWGETPECEKHEYFESHHYGNLSLTNLVPGSTYYARIEKLAPIRILADTWPVRTFDNAEPLVFKTLDKAPAPVEYFVATDGDDSASGRSRREAWRTVQKAADAAGAGDTVWLAEGTYEESIRIRATGTPEAPITFRNMPGEKAIMSGSRYSLNCGFVVDSKSDIHFDGLYLREYSIWTGTLLWSPGESGAFRVSRSERVKINRCFYDGRGSAYPARMLHAWRAPHLELRNTVIMNAYSGIMAGDCPGMVIENCVFVRNSIHAASLSGGRNGTVTFRRNIITDSIPAKKGVSLLELSNTHSFFRAAGDLVVENFLENDNGYSLRLPDDERQLFNFGRTGRMSLAGWQDLYPGSGSILGDPQFAVFKKQDAPTVPEGQYMGDILIRQELDIPELFATDPEFTSRNIGLEPAAFAGFREGW